MINIFETKYNLSNFKARNMINEFGFNKILEECDYIALHDDPEIWGDAIYKWENEENLGRVKSIGVVYDTN